MSYPSSRTRPELADVLGVRPEVLEYRDSDNRNRGYRCYQTECAIVRLGAGKTMELQFRISAIETGNFDLEFLLSDIPADSTSSNNFDTLSVVVED